MSYCLKSHLPEFTAKGFKPVSDPCLWGATAKDKRLLQRMMDRILGRSATEKITDRVAQMCMDRVPMDQIARTHPGFVMMNQRRIQYFHTWINSPMNVEKPAFPGITYRGSDSSTARIVLWAQRNILKPREFKQAQLYIHGPTNSGKTSFVRTLKKWVRVYDLPLFENYYDFYDDRHDLIFVDEFKAQKQLQWMNLLLQGDDFTVPGKGFQYPKHANLPVIIASNFTPRECYQNVAQPILDTFTTRLDVVALKQPIDYQNIKYEPTSDEDLEHMNQLVIDDEAEQEAAAHRARADFDHHLCPFCAEQNVGCRCPARQPPQGGGPSSSSRTTYLHPPFVSARSMIQ